MSDRELPPGWGVYKVKKRPRNPEHERILEFLRRKRLRELLRDRKPDQP